MVERAIGRFCEEAVVFLRYTSVYLKKLSIAGSACLLAGSTQFWTAPSTLAYTIEGKIEHVEQLPPVEQKFKPGAHFDLSAELSPDNVWIKIPAWLAGSWSARDETAVYYQDFKKGISRHLNEQFKAKQDFTYGQQMDKSGQIWHYMGVPYTSKSQHTSYEEIHEVKEKRLVKGDDQAAEFRSLYTVLFIDNFSSNIQRTQQQESLTTYSPLAEDRIAMSASTKVFDAAGRPQNLQRNEAIIKRYRHFTPVNEKDGKDLRALFQQFMASRGQVNLLKEGTVFTPTNQNSGSGSGSGPGSASGSGSGSSQTPVNRPGSDF